MGWLTGTCQSTCMPHHLCPPQVPAASPRHPDNQRDDLWVGRGGAAEGQSQDPPDRWGGVHVEHNLPGAFFSSPVSFSFYPSHSSFSSFFFSFSFSCSTSHFCSPQAPRLTKGGGSPANSGASLGSSFGFSFGSLAEPGEEPVLPAPPYTRPQSPAPGGTDSGDKQQALIVPQ